MPICAEKPADVIEILAFVHPNAGKQIVKGTVETDETIITAAKRELFEESGIVLAKYPMLIGSSKIIAEGQTWYFFQCETGTLSESWSYKTLDDKEHIFEFFWQPLFEELVI